MLKPKEKVPSLEVPLVNDTIWELSAQSADEFIMLVFYRGLHCPVCKKYLAALAEKLEDFEDRGVHVLAVSCNTKELAKQTYEEWDIPNLPLGYDLSIDKAREWGLYISSAISEDEPRQFCEPGLFLIRPDNTLYACSVQSMPFARPAFDDLIKALDFIKKKDYPPRGLK